MGMLTTPQRGRLCRASVCDKGWPRRNDQHGQSRFYTKEKYRRGEPVAAIATQRAGGVSCDTVSQVREDGGPLTGATQGEGRPSKMDRWAPLVDQWLTDDFRRTGSRARHGAPGLAPARRRVQRRRLEQTVRRYVRERGFSLGGSPGCFLDLDWPAGVACRSTSATAFVVRGTGRDALLRRELPLLQRGLAGVPRRERGVRVPGFSRNVFEFVGGVPTRVVFDNATGVGRRVCDRVTPPSSSTCQRPLRVQYRFCNPYSGHEKVRGEQGRDAEETSSSRSRGVGRRRVQRETAGEVARHVAQGALQEGAARARVFEGRPRGDAGAPARPFGASSTGGRAPTRRARSASTAGTGTRRRPSAPGGRWSSGSGRRGSR